MTSHDALRGLTVLNTRPLNQAKDLHYKINNAKGTSLLCPTIEIIAQKYELKIPEKLDIAIFVSVNAVYYALAENYTLPRKIYAIGHATKNALAQKNIYAKCVGQTSEDLITFLKQTKIATVSFGIFKGVGGRTFLRESLINLGAIVNEIALYKRIKASFDKKKLNQWWYDDILDIIIITSKQSLEYLFEMFEKKAYTWLCNKPFLVISARLARSAKEMGVKSIVTAKPCDIFTSLCNFNKGLTHGTR